MTLVWVDRNDRPTVLACGSPQAMEDLRDRIGKGPDIRIRELQPGDESRVDRFWLEQLLPQKIRIGPLQPDEIETPEDLDRCWEEAVNESRRNRQRRSS